MVGMKLVFYHNPIDIYLQMSYENIFQVDIGPMQEQWQIPVEQTFNFALNSSTMAPMLTCKSGKKKQSCSAAWKGLTLSFSIKTVPTLTQAAKIYFGLLTQTLSNALQFEHRNKMDINVDKWNVPSELLHDHDVSRFMSCEFVLMIQTHIISSLTQPVPLLSPIDF